MARRFSAHLGYLFTEVPLEVRFSEAARAGFDLVEHPVPFTLPAPEFRALLRQNGLGMAQMGSGMGGAGRKGIAAAPGLEAAFRRDLLHALDFAEEIGCPLLHPMAGIVESEFAPDRHAGVWLENIAFAVSAAQGRAVSIFVEAISRATVPGYFLHRLDHYLELTGKLDTPPLVLVDSYHAAMNDEDAAAFIRANPERIAHVHVADTPGRHEPGTGSYDFRPLETALAEIGYTGAVGGEYVPESKTRAGLGWRERWPG